MAEAVLGVDVGTRSVRAGLFALDGTRLARSERTIDTTHPRPGWAEQSPRQILEAVFAAISAIRGAGPAPAAISVAATAVSAVPIGPDDQPLGNSLLWMDTRAAAEAAEISRTSHPVLANTGGAVSAEWMLPKVLWLKRHDPERYASARRIVDVHDWLMFELTGQWSLAQATVCGEWSYDPAAGTWPADLLDGFGLLPVLPGWAVPVLPAGAPAGSLTSGAATRTGLAEGTAVVQGLMDSYAAALACHIHQPGRTVLSIGTSSSYLALTASPNPDPRLLGPVPDAFGPGTFVQQGGQTSAAALVEWFSRELAPGVPLGVLDEQASAVPPGAEDLWATDTWQGSRTPYRNPAARGAWGGLSLGHTRAHLFRATLESVAFGGRAVLDTMTAAGIRTASIGVVGGAARSSLWMQIHADVMGRQLRALREDMPVALGAAICAAVGIGAHPSLAKAAETMSGPGPTWEPDAERHATYQPLYEQYLHRVATEQLVTP